MSGDSSLRLKAALAGYQAQYRTHPIGERHNLPKGFSDRVEAVVHAAEDALADLQAYRGLLAYVQIHHPEIGPVRDYFEGGFSS